MTSEATTVFVISLSHIRDSLDPTDCVIEKTDWPFVPRAGEDISLDCEEHGEHHGTVRIVMWDDRGQPQVRYR